ncbi:hypothetical protein KQI89_10155 [Clostridium sp. MSJ-4]|uniref:Uncharacterized protein n=1 Tax=Clostridium simiarum TaxID=2841506 RepID=A0ABS6F0U6_9CLOT|nr:MULTISPECIES: hypothetical protein [Clostridium]MBU5592122.1 hypothetical protein [Clostridium simiarum]
MKGKIIDNSFSEGLIISEDCNTSLLPLNKISSVKKAGDKINLSSSNGCSSSRQRLIDFY